MNGKVKLELAGWWYQHATEPVLENGDFKVLWDFKIQCDGMIEATRPDISRISKIVDIAIPEIKILIVQGHSDINTTYFI